MVIGALRTDAITKALRSNASELIISSVEFVFVSVLIIEDLDLTVEILRKMNLKFQK